MEVQFVEWKFRFVLELQYLKEFIAILWTAALSKCTINIGYLNLNLIKFKLHILNPVLWNFSGGPVAKNPLPNAGDVVLILGQGTKDPTYQGATEPMCHN